METVNKIWKDIDIVKPFKTFFIVFSISVAILGLVSFFIPFFPEELIKLSKYKILDNYNLEFRYFMIILILILFISVYLIIFFKHNLLKFRGIEAGVILPSNMQDGKTVNSGNLRCVFYSNLGAFYKISKIVNKEQFRLEGNCKITNITDSKMYVSSIRFKDNFTGAFDVWDSHGEGSINPNKVSTTHFWGYVDTSLFKPKQDIITDVIITDNLGVEYTLRNIRFRFIPSDETKK